MPDAGRKAAFDEAGASDRATRAALGTNAEPGLGGPRAAPAVLALAALLALFFTQRIPATQPGSAKP